MGLNLICSNTLMAEPWRPDESSAVFTVNPNKVLGSSYFKEVLNPSGLIGFGYSSIMRDHHLMDFQKEMGVKIEDTTEVSLVVGNFHETLMNFPVTTSGNYDTLNDLSMALIVRTKEEVSPDTVFEKFDRWASGPAFHPSDIDRFRKDDRIEAEKIAQMSKARRLRQELYAGMEKSEKVGKTTLFPIPMGMLDQSLQKYLESPKFSIGMEAENGSTTFALGDRDSVLGFFAHENKPGGKGMGADENVVSFSIPLNGEILKAMGNNQLSDPNGPLGPLAITLGDALYNIEEISGDAKFVGGMAHFDLMLICKDAQSAQSIWSMAQASLGMAQLSALRQQMKNPQVQLAVPLNFLNKIKLKHQGNEVHTHFEALPAELFPWAANKKFP